MSSTLGHLPTTIAGIALAALGAVRRPADRAPVARRRTRHPDLSDVMDGVIRTLTEPLWSPHDPGTTQ
jgi:hypothetical protein